MMHNDTSPRPDMSPETRREIVKWIAQSALGVAGYGIILFLAAGTLNWLWGWVLLAALAAFLAAHPLILIPINPELLAQREKGLLEEGVKTWDRWISFFGARILPMASWIVAALDVRFNGMGSLSLAVHLGGLVVMVLGYALFLWAMASNAGRISAIRGADSAGGSRFARRVARLRGIYRANALSSAATRVVMRTR